MTPRMLFVLVAVTLAALAVQPTKIVPGQINGVVITPQITAVEVIPQNPDATYTVPASISPVRMFRNGLLQIPGVDYTLTGTTVAAALWNTNDTIAVMFDHF
jgi:hypothetical protein